MSNREDVLIGIMQDIVMKAQDLFCESYLPVLWQFVKRSLLTNALRKSDDDVRAIAMRMTHAVDDACHDSVFKARGEAVPDAAFMKIFGQQMIDAIDVAMHACLLTLTYHTAHTILSAYDEKRATKGMPNVQQVVVPLAVVLEDVPGANWSSSEALRDVLIVFADKVDRSVGFISPN
jgi:hypothetical protein